MSTNRVKQSEVDFDTTEGKHRTDNGQSPESNPEPEIEVQLQYHNYDEESKRKSNPGVTNDIERTSKPISENSLNGETLKSKEVQLDTRSKVDTQSTDKPNLVGMSEEPTSLFLKIDRALGEYFYKIGHASARRPWTWIGCASFFVLLCMAGWSQKDDEERPERLWVPDVAQGLEDIDWTEVHWPTYTGMEIAIFEADNVLTKNNLDLIWQKMYDIEHIEIDGKLVVEGYNKERKTTDGSWAKYGFKYVYDFTTLNPETVERKRKCLVRFGKCTRADIFDVLGADRNNKNWIRDNIGSDADLLLKINAYKWGENNNYQKKSLFSGISHAGGGTDGKITGVTHMQVRWEQSLDPFVDEKDGNRRKTPVEFWWEREALCILGFDSGEDRDGLYGAAKCSQNKLPIKTYAYFLRSLTDEFRATIDGDVGKIGMAIVLIIFYLIITLGKRCDCVRGMYGLSLAAVVVIMCAAAGGLGLAYWFGIKNCVLANNVYFLILGLGVDDAFVLTAEYNRATALNPVADIPDRIGMTMKTGGMSILVTSLTDAIAFFIGGSSTQPALRFFCFYAAFAVTLCFIFQLIFIGPFLAINGRRQDREDQDCLWRCCMKPAEKREDTGCCLPAAIRALQCCGFKICAAEPLLPQLLRAYTKKAMTPAGKFAAVTIWLGVLTLSIIGIANLKADFKLEWFAPEDSYVTEFYYVSEQYFSQGTRFSVYFKDFGGYTETQLYECAANVETYMQKSQYIDQPAMRPSFFNKLTTWSAGSGSTLSSGNFYSRLKAWPEMSNNVGAFVDTNDASKGLSKLRFTNGIIRNNLIMEGTDRWDTMEGLRNDMKSVCPVAFPFTIQFLWWEEVGYIGAEFVRNASICLSVILLIVFAMIPEVKVNIPTILAILATITDVIGFFYYWDETINGVICIYTVICIGLAVDYSAHIGHIFRLTQPKEANARAVNTMARIGPSVTHALLSTLLAVMVLSPAKSFVFRVFFKVLFLVVMFGILNALCILPVLLSFFNGGMSSTMDPDTIDAGMHHENGSQQHEAPGETAKPMPGEDGF